MARPSGLPPTQDRSSSLAAQPSSLSPPTPDLFVLVRPPPSSTGHPLNVQIQLLSPSTSRGPSAHASSGFGRPSSFLSTVTGPTTPGSTDGRSFDAVAGASVGHSPAQDNEEHRRSRSPSVSSMRSVRSGDSASTRGTSMTGTSGGGTKRRVTPLLNLQYHNLLPTVVIDAGTEQRVARFHKRGVEFTGLAIFDPTHLSPPTTGTSSSLAVPTTPPTSSSKPDSGLLGKFKRLSFNPSAAPSSLSPSSAAHGPDSAPTPHTISLIRTPSPTPPLGSTQPASEKRAGYAFLLRKWLRSDLLEAPRGVRIEWTRAPLKHRTRRVQSNNGSAPQSRRGSAHDVGAEPDVEAGEVVEEEVVEEEEERAWVCTLVYPLSGAAASPDPGAASSPAASPAASPPLSGSPNTQQQQSHPATRRLTLATLRPAPHHPKLVSTLLLPPALPSIPLGFYHPAQGLVGGALGPEDLRDLAMVTALFVAVREGLGGLEGVVPGDAGGGVGLGLGTSRSAGGEGPRDGVAALTEKAGLAIQGLVSPVVAGGKRSVKPPVSARNGGGFASGIGRLFGSK